MAAVDSNYQYTIIDVGAQGRQSDGGILKSSEFGKALASGTLGAPSASCLPGTRTVAPYAFVGDEAFQLRKDFMRPFPAKQLTDERRVFNYRLSRARRCAENAFGITAARWRVLLRTINLHPTNVDSIIKAACILHNFIMKLNAQRHGYVDREDSFGNVIPGHWRQSVGGDAQDGSQPYFSLASTHARNFHTQAADARNIFTAYFCSTFGEVAWQWQQPGVSKDVALKHLQEQQLLPLVAAGFLTFEMLSDEADVLYVVLVAFISNRHNHLSTEASSLVYLVRSIFLGVLMVLLR
ncbi:uncharacterized protein [Dermacentor andersoni]|uniref:uncharacterized protein n=1 Tax=Dermacentor andersoni TaxID=34620 RepID=UPI002417F43B|nr:uncharacterized protein LOC126516548 [Dermacentor andersoni]